MSSLNRTSELANVAKYNLILNILGMLPKVRVGKITAKNPREKKKKKDVEAVGWQKCFPKRYSNLPVSSACLTKQTRGCQDPSSYPHEEGFLVMWPCSYRGHVPDLLITSISLTSSNT